MKRKYIKPYTHTVDITLETSGLCVTSDDYVQSQSSLGGKSGRYKDTQEEGSTWGDLWGD